ncbi:calcium-independent phospholipase A2-gamma isoform X2 [Protopterus annectens]|uniref:calcium-independent phospholipase A2-gamma isoform X2 n=1 Tax=Protopterus annectens TaxID=7888 RepID=UPI001CFAC7B4|nr:calcium-independent phospholipase A2-gamma isoform X2 [Protopterus annectens]
MPVSWILETYIYVLRSTRNLWLRQGQRALCFSAYVSYIHSKTGCTHAFPACCLNKSASTSGQVFVRQGCYEWNRCSVLPSWKGNCIKHKCKLQKLRNNTYLLHTSSLRHSAGLSHRMLQIRSTLNTVSKAIKSTSHELVAKIAKFKLNLNIAGKTSQVTSQIVKNVKTERRGTLGSRFADVSEKDFMNEPTVHTNTSSKLNWNIADIKFKKAYLGKCTDEKECKDDLFHASYLTTNFGETYRFLSNHINFYFKDHTIMDKAKAEKPADSRTSAMAAFPEPGSGCKGNKEQHTLTSSVISTASIDSATQTADIPAPTKKSIADFLLHPTDKVHALMDNYLGGLVPKLKYEAKDTAEQKSKVQEGEITEKKEEQVNEKEAMSADDKAKRLSLQREKEKILPCILRLREAKDETLQAAVSEMLAIIGYANPVKGRGIRVLTIDGGGTRGIVALQTLRRLEELTGKSVYKLFDYICGVSTGAVLAFMLGLFHLPLDECEELYRKLGSDVFKQNVILGTVKMGWSHAFYDTEIWEKILRERMGSNLMIETARNPNYPKIAAVSTIVNRGTPLKAFIFRNYNHFPGVKSHYLGSSQYKLWQAIRASSAAPGYFQEYALGNDLHQDGGLLINNPCALALHECKCLWPNTPLQCVISLGTGRFESLGKSNVTYTSLKTKLTNVISSATDTEEVHTMLDALLPPDTYFRFNPVMTEDVPLDENRKEKLGQLLMEGKRYLDRNEIKLKKAAKILTKEKTSLQKLNDWIKLKADMYDGLPFFSKL